SMVLVERGASVIQWSHAPEMAHVMQTTRANPRYLPGYTMPDGVTVTNDVAAVSHADLIFSAVPSRYLREVLTGLRPHAHPARPVLGPPRGLVSPGPGRAPEISGGVLGPRARAVLSAPSHAEEVVLRMPTAVVAASRDLGLALRVQDLLTTERFRVYT